ncbi:MAG: ABC transporter permease [Alphaproteobacteria bacterium]
MIDIKTTGQIAIRAIIANKMRSCLTSLGIIIGVASVIIMLSIGNGAQVSIQKDMQSMGSNLLVLRSGIATSGGAKTSRGSKPTLKKSDGDAVAERVDGILFASPSLDQSEQVIYGNTNWLTTITGTDNNYFTIKDWAVEYGKGFSDSDLENASMNAIIGTTIATELFGDVDPVNKTVRIKGLPFKIIGVLEERGESGNEMDQDDAVFIPITTAQKKVMGIQFPDEVKHILLQAKDLESTYSTQEEIRAILRQKHNLGNNKDDDFVIMNMTQMQEAMQNSTKVLTLLLGSIASISLLVGGIGVMNIMLVSVTERTREIGIRMAIGAKKWDIRLQFITEAVVLSLIGGLIGATLGILGSMFMPGLGNFEPILDITYVMLPFCVSGIVGIIFGYYPAYKASLLNPINALRFE